MTRQRMRILKPHFNATRAHVLGALFASLSLCTLQAAAQAHVHRTRTSVYVAPRRTTVTVNKQVNVYAAPHYDRWGHPVARAAAVTATAVAVGTVVATLPPRCTVTVVGNVTYQNCGGVFYQPVYHGSTVQYVVVTHP